MDHSEPPQRRPGDAANPATAPEVVGAFIRSARELQGLSQTQVAVLTEGQPGTVSRTTIGDIERGRNLPNLQAVISLSRVLHFQPAEVLERADLTQVAPIDLTGLSRAELFDRADKLFWAGDYRSALHIYDTILEHLALDPPEDAEEFQRLRAMVEVARAVALRRCGALFAAAATAERAVDLALNFPSIKAEAYIVLAELWSQRGRAGLAIDAAVRAVELTENAALTLQARALLQHGTTLFRAERYEDAHGRFIQARTAIIQAEDRSHRATIEGNIGACLMQMGKPQHARTRFIECVKLAREYQFPAIEGSFIAALGRLSFDSRDFDDADRYATEALKVAEPRGHTLTIFRALWLRYLVAQERDPEPGNARRLAQLKKIYSRIKDNEGVIEVREFRDMVATPTQKRSR